MTGGDVTLTYEDAEVDRKVTIQQVLGREGLKCEKARDNPVRGTFSRCDIRWRMSKLACGFFWNVQSTLLLHSSTVAQKYTPYTLAIRQFRMKPVP